MPPSARSARPPARRGALCLAALLAFSSGFSVPSGPARAQDVLELMGAMDQAFSALVHQVFVLPVQNLGDPPFAAAAQEAAKLAETASRIPRTDAFPGDQGFLKRAAEALAAARQVEAAAREKRLDGAAAALLRLHAACTGCHKDFRF